MNTWAGSGLRRHKMLSQQQINNLITGREMAAELPASGDGLRRFLTILPLEMGKYGQFIAVSKVLSRSKYETVYFWVRVYELPAVYIEKQWDVTEEELTACRDLGKIQGITALEAAIEEYLQDFSMLLTWDKTEAPL